MIFGTNTIIYVNQEQTKQNVNSEENCGKVYSNVRNSSSVTIQF